MIILRYPDSWDGFLSALSEASDRRGQELTLRRQSSPATFYETIEVETADALARKAEKALQSLGKAVPEMIYQAWLSEHEDIETAILGFLRHGFALKCDPFGDMTHPDVRTVRGAARDVGWEAHRMLQFVRFVQSPEGIYIADIEPLYDILLLIAKHFHGRFNDQKLMIRDLRRRKALVSRTEGWAVADLGDGPLPPLPRDSEFEDMWRGYFKAIANPARKNLKLQQQFVPLRYRAHLTEFQQES